MGLLDDIKNMKPLPEHKWTLEELLKVERKLLKKREPSVMKALIKKDNIQFTNKDKLVVIDFDRVKDYYKNERGRDNEGKV